MFHFLAENIVNWIFSIHLHLSKTKFIHGINHSIILVQTFCIFKGLSPHSKSVTIGEIRELLEENKRCISSKAATPTPLPEPPPQVIEQKVYKEFPFPLQNISSGQGKEKFMIFQ